MINANARFTINYGNFPEVIPFTCSVFSGGEVNVKLLPTIPVFEGNSVTITARMTQPEDLVILMMLTDACKRMFKPKHLRLIMPYVPYARQDRVCNRGEALAVKVFCDAINSQGYDEVVVVDPHSDVAPALLNNVTIRDQAWVMSGLTANINVASDILVIPDAGAAKKCLKVANKLGFKSDNVVEATKVRDVATRQITATKVNCESSKVTGQVCYIFDDICDNGGTFIALAKELKSLGARHVILCVSHGIFPNGVDHIYEGGVDEIWTSDSLFGYTKDSRVNVLPIKV